MTGSRDTRQELKELEDKPYFYAKKVNGHIEVSGVHSCSLGHTIPGDKNEGVYARWDWNGQALTVRNDRYGYYPLYYYQTDDEIAISSSLLKILNFCGSPKLNYSALSVFLRIGFFLRGDTPFENIKAFPPNVNYIWPKEASVPETHYSIAKPLHTSRDDAIDGFIDLFHKAITKRLPQDDHFVVPISGGRDSRHILLELLQQGRSPKFCITHHHFPTRSDEDVRVATILLKEVNIEHVKILQNQSRFQNELRKNIMTNFCSDEHTHTLVMADYLKSKTHIMYDGIAGMLAESYLFDPKQCEQFRTGKFDQLSDALFEKFGPEESILKRILNEESYNMLSLESAKERLIEELKGHRDAPFPISSFHFWNRTRREINLIPYAIFDGIPTVYSPYLDYELCPFLMSLPENILIDRTFHTETIQRSYPQYADIPFSNPHPEKPDSRDHVNQYTREFVMHSLKRMQFKSRFIKDRYIMLRALRGLFDRKYCFSLSWLSFSPLIYLWQLEQYMKR